MAARALLDSGHTRIGGIFKRDDMQGQLRCAGYREALEQRGLPPQENDLLWFTTDTQRDFVDLPEGQAFLRALGDRLDALVCYNDEAALLVARFLRENGLSQQISLVSFDNSAYASLCQPALTSLDHPKDAFGRLAAQKLLRMIAGEKQENAEMPWTLVTRESVHPR